MKSIRKTRWIHLRKLDFRKFFMIAKQQPIERLRTNILFLVSRPGGNDIELPLSKIIKKH